MRKNTAPQMPASTSTDIVQSLKRKATKAIEDIIEDLIEEDNKSLRKTSQRRLQDLKKLSLENQGLKTRVDELQKKVDEMQIDNENLSKDNENLRTRLNIQAQERRKITLELLEQEDGERPASEKCAVCFVGELALSFKTGNSLKRLCCSVVNCCDKIYMCTDCHTTATARNEPCVICRNVGTYMITYEQRLTQMQTQMDGVIDLSDNGPPSPPYHPGSPAYHP